MQTQIITPDRIKEVLTLVEENRDIYDALRSKKMSPHTFFAALRLNPELAEFYSEQRKFTIEALLERSLDLIRAAEDKLALKKAEIELEYFKWKAEKLIPEVYGAKVQIDINKTIDIRGALDEAEARAKDFIDARFKSVSPPTLPEPEKVETVILEPTPDDLIG